MLRREQDQDLRAFQVVFDRYFLESSLYESGAVEQAVSALKEAGHTFEEQDALWLRTTDFGDDKDRVMRKREGHTYFVPDVAHHDKWQRGFTRVINEQGLTTTAPSPGSGRDFRVSMLVSRGLARVRAASDGDRDARWRRSETV